MPHLVTDWFHSHGAKLGFICAVTALSAAGSSGCIVAEENADESAGVLPGLVCIDAAVAADDPPVPATIDGGTLPARPGDAGAHALPTVEIRSAAAYPRRCRARAVIGADRTTATLAFDDLELALERGLTSVYCAVETAVRVPPGYAFTLEGISGAATAALPSGASVQIETAFSFQRLLDRDGQRVATALHGPLEGSIHFQQDFPKPGFYCGNDSVDLSVLVVLKNDTDHTAKVSLTSLEVGRFTVQPCT